MDSVVDEILRDLKSRGKVVNHKPRAIIVRNKRKKYKRKGHNKRKDKNDVLEGNVEKLWKRYKKIIRLKGLKWGKLIVR